MNADFWKKLACAAALTLSMGLAHRSLASPGRCEHVKRPPDGAVNESVLRGRGLLKFAGYELNVTFTSGGKLIGFDISAAPKTRQDSKV